jgi:hypothetical protein
VLVDEFTLTEANSPRYVLPEESLKVLEGERADGLWQLEILDTRSGASNNVSLLDWQLAFVFQTNTAVPRTLIPGVPVVTTNLPPGQIIYFIVDVPTFARFATNVLFNANPGGFLLQPNSSAVTRCDKCGRRVTLFLQRAMFQNHTEVSEHGAHSASIATRPAVFPRRGEYQRRERVLHRLCGF